jgi:hypothetical protein
MRGAGQSKIACGRVGKEPADPPADAIVGESARLLAQQTTNSVRAKVADIRTAAVRLESALPVSELNDRLKHAMSTHLAGIMVHVGRMEDLHPVEQDDLPPLKWIGRAWIRSGVQGVRRIGEQILTTLRKVPEAHSSLIRRVVPSNFVHFRWRARGPTFEIPECSPLDR